MRFLCEQCKAKYQIADEKVAGKTVRMKCRKCGHLIEVKAEVTETSVASQAPQPPPPQADGGDEATRVGVDVNALMKMAGMGALPTAGAPAKPGAPRPGGPGPQAAKPALATSFAAAKPARPSSRPDSALAGAFQRSVQKEDDLALLEISTSSEWYVAINGVPVGPVRVTELRRKAHSGAVTEESLVWQEGMEEWRPLKTVPELLAIVQEGMTSDRPSLVSPEPPRHSAPPRRTPSVHPAAPAKSATPAPPRSNVVSLASRLATAEKLEPEPMAAPVRDPFAVPPVSSERPAAVAIDPFAPATTAAGASAPISPLGAPNVSSTVTEVPTKRPGPNWVVLGMVVAFGAFGVTAGIAVFFNKPPPPAPAPTIVVTAAAPTAPAGTTPAANSAAEANVAPTAVASSGRPAAGGAGTRPPTGGAAAATTSTGKAVDPSIAALLGGPGTGPSVGGSSGGGGGGSALSQEAIERVVQQRSAGVKRTCWERGGGTESNVNVRVHLTIAASGGVQSASAEGNDPIVSRCIENSVRGWTFPPSSGPTTVDIPFHFLRQ